MHGREAGENTHGALNVSRCPGSAGAHARSICPTASRGLGERCAALEADEGICGTQKASRGLGEPCTGREAGENTHGALNVSRCPWSAATQAAPREPPSADLAGSAGASASPLQLLGRRSYCSPGRS